MLQTQMFICDNAECRCHQALGAVLPAPAFFCTHEDCKYKRFGSLKGLEDHQRNVMHDCSAALCQECGRLHQKHLRPLAKLDSVTVGTGQLPLKGTSAVRKRVL